MVQFLEWEGLRGRGLTGDLEPILMAWMNLNGLEWTWMDLNGFEWVWMTCDGFQQEFHYNPFQLVQSHSNLVEISMKITLNVIETHSNSFKPIQVHSNPFQSSLNPPINPYLLAPPILGTQLKRTNNSSFWRFHSSPFKFSFGLYPKG